MVNLLVLLKTFFNTRIYTSHEFVKIPRKSINDILNTIGYTHLHFKFILVAVFSILNLSFNLNMMSNIIIPLTNYLKLTDLDKKLISSIFFLGGSLGSLTLGKMTSLFTRNAYMIVNLVILASFQLLFSLSKSVNLIIICRFFIGYSSMVNYNLSLNSLIEYLPTKLRGFTLTIIGSFFGPAQGVCLILMLYIMPNFEIFNLQFFLICTWMIVAANCLFTFFLLEQSARDLIINNYEFQGVEILKYIAEEELNYKLSKTDKFYIINDIKSSMTDVNLKHSQSNYSAIFNQKYWLISALLILVFIFMNFYNNGIFLTISLFAEFMEIKAKKTITDMILISFLGCIGTVIGSILCEVPSLGRKKTLIYSTFAQFCIVALCLVFPHRVMLFMILFSGLNNIIVNLSTSFAMEIYHTKLRDTAMGILFIVNRVGSTASQFVYLIFYDIYPFLIFWVSLVILVIMIFGLIFLPNSTETCNRDLDTSKL